MGMEKASRIVWGDPKSRAFLGKFCLTGLFNVVYLVMVEQKTYFKPPNRKELARS